MRQRFILIFAACATALLAAPGKLSPDLLKVVPGRMVPAIIRYQTKPGLDKPVASPLAVSDAASASVGVVPATGSAWRPPGSLPVFRGGQVLVASAGWGLTGSSAAWGGSAAWGSLVPLGED